jgi:PhzF family phenazine biosynthesis protein
MRFKQVDVFTARAFLGNPVAVVFDGESLDTAAMQRIACWTNLSETTFLLPPTTAQADYRLRIFTPRQELPFAGHPSIGSAHAALEARFVSRKGRLRQECGAGILELTAEDDGRVFLRGPEPRVAPLELNASAFGITLAPGSTPVRVDVGPVWIVGELADAQSLAALSPDMSALAEWSRSLEATGVTVFAPSGDGESAIHVRSFAPAHGIAEDPVCGSGNLSVAAYLRFKGQAGRFGEQYVARQGMALGRDGRVAVRLDPDGLRIGGHAVTCVEGTLRTQ